MHRKAAYNSITDIASIILEAAQGGEKKTRLMQAAFISLPQLKDYVLMLQEKLFLEYDSTNDTYYTTEKGKRFLSICQSLEGILRRVDDGRNDKVKE